MMSTATAAVNANAALSPAPSQNPRVAAATTRTTGTKTPEMRSARRWTGALPLCASVTSLAIWARAVSDPTFVARTTRRPPTLTVAPTTSSPGPSPRERTRRQQRLVDRRGALLDDAVRGDLLARPDHEAVAGAQVLDADAALGAVRAQDGDVLGAELESAASAEPARRLARASKNRPARMKVMTTAATSK
jgi:hypothetical protein